MPRDSSGNYTLPAGNPVVDGTIIEAPWANSTLSDIALQLNNVLTRDGLLGPTGPVLFVDGTLSAPGIAWSSEPGMGWYRAAANTTSFAIAGAEKARFGPNNARFLSGILSLGPTPAAWGSGISGLQLYGGSVYSINNGSAGYAQNLYFNGTDLAYLNSGNPAAAFLMSAANHLWFTAPTGNAGDVATLTERMRISSEGYIGLGSTAANATFPYTIGGGVPFVGGNPSKYVRLHPTDGADLLWGSSEDTLLGQPSGQIAVLLQNADVAMGIGTLSAKPLHFGTNNGARMTVTSSGDVVIGATSALGGSDGRRVLEVVGSNQALVGLTVSGVFGGYWYYDIGTELVNFGTSASPTPKPLSIVIADIERARFHTNGNLSLGTTGNDSMLQLRRDVVSTVAAPQNQNVPRILINNRGTTGTSVMHRIGSIDFAGYRDVADPSIVASIWAENLGYPGTLGSLKFGALNNGSANVPPTSDEWALSVDATGNTTLYPGGIAYVRTPTNSSFLSASDTVGYRGAPRVEMTGGFQVTSAHNGAMLNITQAGTTYNWTLNNFIQGNAWGVINSSGGSATLQAQSGAGFILVGVGARSSITIAHHGMAYCWAANSGEVWVSGTGLS